MDFLLKTEKKIYSKQKSFVNLNLFFHKDKIKALKIKIKNILETKNKANNIVKNQVEIINFLKSDLFENGTNNRPKFELSPNIVKEIFLLEDGDILKYLLHRYRYDIYPQIYMLDNYPPYLQIEPSSICNYRCVFCFQTNKDFTKKSHGYMGHMTLDVFKRTVDQVEGNIEFISLASRGEPLSCPDIEKMLIYAKGKFLNLKINTNASLLNERKSHAILQNDVRTLVFSADAADSELYSSLRVNGKLSKVVSNIKQFKKIREKNYPHSKIITRVSGVKVSEKQNYKDMEKFWGNLADQVAFVDYCPWENVYNRVKNTITAPCSELWRRMYIWCDGKTNPCEVDYRSELSTGYIANNNISKLWKSVSYNKLRQNHKSKLRNAVSPCNRCSVV
jgi:organic radical activating enzyme